MMKKLLLAGAAFLMAGTAAFAQHRNCGTDEHHNHLIETDAKYAAAHAAVEAHTARALERGANQVTGVITIPVVVHVVYNTSAENISDAQIDDQMRIINEDFRKLNADVSQTPALFAGRTADFEMEFVLDQVIRVSTTRTSFSSNDAMKFTSQGGSNAVSPTTKLNMWVCDLSGGLLGYAQFPGGAASTDGVVMDYQYFGSIGTATAPYDGGRTTTHEIGHWVNLRHIWGDGNCNADDFVSDTPTMGGSNGGCPTFGINSCGSGGSDEPDMFMNYMDYVYDDCMFMFTEGQKARARAIFSTGGARESFVNGGGGGGPITCADASATGTADLTLNLTTDNYGSETTWELADADGNVVTSGSGYGNNTTYNVAIPVSDGAYTFTIYDSYGDGICCSYGSGSYSLTDGDGATLVSGASFANSEATIICIDGTGGGGGGGGGGDATLVSTDFESGLDGWVDGGGDCALYTGGTYSAQGSNSVRIRDDSRTSFTTYNGIDASAYSSVTVDFSFVANSMETGEDFFVEVNGSQVAAFVSGTDFNNRTLYNVSIPLSGSQFGSNGSLTFRCDASANNDQVYIDEVVVTGSNARTSGAITIEAKEMVTRTIADAADVALNVNVYPNPTNSLVNVVLEGQEEAQLSLFNLNGQVVRTVNAKGSVQLDLGALPQGVYVLRVVSGTEAVTRRIIKQ